MTFKTFTTKTAEIQRDWWVVDAEGQNLGRLAARIAAILRGKHKPTFSPHMDTGDHIIVINCEKIQVSGNKLDDKIYYRHSQYPSGLTKTPLRNQLERFPDRVIMDAVRGMLPKNALGRQLLRKLKVYKGSTHPHDAQKPKELKF